MLLIFKSAVAFFFLFFLHGTSIGTRQQGISYNGLQIGDRFVKRWHCAVGQTAANVLLGDRYFLCGGIYEY